MANRFDIYRTQSLAKSDKAAGKQREAMDRRLAQLGGTGPSGANIKLEQDAANENTAESQAALAQIAAAESQNAQQIAEAQKNRDFAKEENAAQRTFAADQIKYGRDYATSENAAKRATGLDMFKNQLKLQERMANNDARTNMGIFRMQNALARQEFDWQKTVDQFNMEMGQKIAGQKDIFGRAGDFGTGLWNKTGLTV